MSNVWSDEERARRLGRPAPPKPDMDAIGKLAGCAFGIVVLILFVAGLGALVTMLWRAAIR